MASITTYKSNGDKAGDSPKMLGEMLQYLGHQERPFYQGFKEVVNDREEWRVEVFIHTKKPNKPLIIEAACRRSTFHAGIRDAACQAMYRLRDMYADDLSNTPYHYFPRRRICNTEKEILHYYKKTKHHHQHDTVLIQLLIRLTMVLVAGCDDAMDELREAQYMVRELEEELRKAPRHKHNKAIIAASSPPPNRHVIVGVGESGLCLELGCAKGARGSSGRCIAHGGGRKCQKEGCNKGAEGKTVFCKAHGVGKRCEHLRCTKSAEGRTGFCIAHGGGRRCQYAGCGKGSQGSTNLCIVHGGGKRCTHPNCSKGAEGSTPFCKAHGGGKRCAVDGCRRSARGRTDRCVGHGGGKRCHFTGCGKSAQGSTDFCKSHGGGRRCSWGHPGSELGSGGAPCDRLARGKRGLCDRHNPLVDDNRVHGGVSFGGFMHTVEAPRHVAASAHEGRVHGGNFMPIMLDGGVGLGVNNADASTSAPRYWKNMEKPFGSAQRS